MTRALALVLVAGAAAVGCGKDDLCGNMLAQDVVCYTVHLGGSIDDGPIDKLQVDSTYNELGAGSSSTRITVRSMVGVDPMSSDMGTANLPISFPLVYKLPAQPDESSDVVVVALSAGKQVGIGNARLGVGSLNLSTPKPGTSNSVDIKLNPASKDDCFNPNVFGSSSTNRKSDRLCGGDACQACTLNHTCNSSTDCVFPLTCKTVSGSSTFVETCQQ